MRGTVVAAVVLMALPSVALAPAPDPLSAPGPALARVPSALAAAARDGLVRDSIVLDPTLQPARGRVSPQSTFQNSRAALDVTVDEETVHFALRSVMVLPGTSVVIESGDADLLRYAAGTVRPRGSGRWAWQAPERPGVHALRIEAADGRAVDLVAFVMTPRSRETPQAMGSYRIGTYRPEPLSGRDEYLPPRGFIEVSPADEDIRISPHITLGEILCKQPGIPRYAVFTNDLIAKLETVLEEVNARGISVGSLTLMSGFRTPWYNRSIGNTTDYSRHLWGDAADVYIDRDGDGDMDDLNGDGVRNLADARVLADIIESVGSRSVDGFTPGGMSLYRRNAAHGPFVHIDARGLKARW